MSVYTVHEPPLRAADAFADPERFVFVRDGFSVWAFLAAVLWMLWHRMWWVLLIYVVVIFGLDAALRYAGASPFVVAVTALFVSLLVGIEAGTLRRFTLGRRGWKNIGVVSGANAEEAELRFFNAWIREAAGKHAGPPVEPSAQPSPLPRMPQSPAVIGLFPEPGGNR